MAFVKITPKTLIPLTEQEGYWFDWDEWPTAQSQEFIQRLAASLQPLPFGDVPFCILVRHLASIPQELLSDSRHEGILFVEKSQVELREDGSFDVARLFDGVRHDLLSYNKEVPEAENWKLDHQGYLVRDNRPDKRDDDPHNSSKENPYMIALQLLDASSRIPQG